jgi:hypothetical protein
VHGSSNSNQLNSNNDMETIMYKGGKIGKIPFVTDSEEREDGFYTIIENRTFKYVHGMWMEVTQTN